MCKRLEACPKCGQEYIKGVGARIHIKECPGRIIKPSPMLLAIQ